MRGRGVGGTHTCGFFLCNTDIFAGCSFVTSHDMSDRTVCALCDISS